MNMFSLSLTKLMLNGSVFSQKKHREKNKKHTFYKEQKNMFSTNFIKQIFCKSLSYPRGINALKCDKNIFKFAGMGAKKWTIFRFGRFCLSIEGGHRTSSL